MGRSRWAWAPPGDVVVVSPANERIDASVTVPGSKSVTNRALIVAALATGESRVTGLLRSDDSYWAVKMLRDLGIELELDDTTARIVGGGGRWPRARGRLYVGSAGTLARFLPGALAAGPMGEWVVDGSDQLRSRPLAPLITALSSLGVTVTYESSNEGLPIRVRTGFPGGEVDIPGNVSSQFTSGVIMAAPYSRDGVTVRVRDGLVQSEYVGMTVGLMEDFGARVRANDDATHIYVAPGRYEGRAYTVEGDASTASYFLALAALTGGKVRVANVGYNSSQPDARFVDVLERMGCTVVRTGTELTVVGPHRLRGNMTVDMRPMSDQALTLGVLSIFADGPVTVTGVPHIRRHESDRIAVFSTEMGRLGIRVEERSDGFKVFPGLPRLGGAGDGPILDPHDDHRHAMAFALIGSRLPGLRIADAGCVSKTCPPYFDMLARLGVTVAYEDAAS